jgi:hypothetical protein
VPLSSAHDVADWRMEGPGTISFPCGRLRLESIGQLEEGQKSNLVFWCPQPFPDHVRISWDFYPIYEPGLAILFFAAKGREGEHVLDAKLPERHGPYNQYHHGAINAYHLSYFRRKQPDEIRFHTCNLRKSYGHHLVRQGGDPIPTVHQADPPYRISVIKSGALVGLCIDDLLVFEWRDPGEDLGPVLGDGSIGFRQMNPLIAEYADLRVDALEPKDV